MTLLGKILALLNVFAAVGFLYLASQDWAKRQIWSAAVLRNEAVIHGLPVDEGSVPPGIPATLTADNLTSAIRGELFQKVGGAPSRTQLQEVQQKHIEILDRLRAQPDDAARRRDVGDILLSLASSTAEREARVRQLADRSVRTDTLVQELDQRFQDVLRKQTADGQPRDPAEHRQAIAALLFGLSTDPAWHQRVQVVVGLTTYGQHADAMGAALKDMIARQQHYLARERADFEVVYRKLIEDRLQLLDRQVRDLDQIKKDQMALKTKHQGVVNARVTVRDDLQKKLAGLMDAVAKVRAQQDSLADGVFKAQRDLATAADENLELEKQIRSLEQGR